MKSIEITTAQKVVIRYDLASLRDRVLAYLVDMIILGVALGIIFAVVISSLYEQTDVMFVVLAFTALPLFLFYTLAFEIFMNGKTPGKRALGLKVISLDGSIPTIEDLLIRWVFRWIDIYTSFGAVAALMINAGDKSQRMGGLLSNTVVVKNRESYGIRLDDLERMHNDPAEEPSYPGVICFNDVEMLSLKGLLSRYSRYPNKAHRDLLSETARAVAERLGLKKIPENHRQFLQTVLRDYVLLTR